MVGVESSYVVKLFELPFISLEFRFLKVHLKRTSAILVTVKNVFLLQRYDELFFLSC